MEFKKTRLENGISILSEHHGESRCVVTGFWVKAGTRFETPQQMGLSHCLEHMVFKGTEKYKALELALSMESKGGDINAFTGREHTCFHTTSLKEFLHLSVDVLSQLVGFASFPEAEFSKEKGVIQQEILMASDELEDHIYDLYFEKIFSHNSLGYPILGSLESVEKLSIPDLKTYYDRYFTPENIIVTAAGDVNHQELVEGVEKAFRDKKWSSPESPPSFPRPPPQKIKDFVQKDCEQFHIIMGFPACSYSASNRFNGFMVNTALGGGMTSKLYQKIREERGLVYSIFSTLNTFTDTGLQTIYGGTEKKYVNQVIDLIEKELKSLRKKGLSQEEIKLYKTQAKGQIIIGSEDIDNRMQSIATNEMVFGEYRSVDRVLSDIDQVNQDSVMEYVEEFLDEDLVSLLVLGPETLGI